MTPAAEAMVSLIQVTIGTVLGPLVGQIDAQRQTIERQADRVAELERENGRLTAENAALAARTADMQTSVPIQPTPAWWSRWRMWLAASLIAVMVGTASCGQVASAKHPELCRAMQDRMSRLAAAMRSDPNQGSSEVALHTVQVAEGVC